MKEKKLQSRSEQDGQGGEQPSRMAERLGVPAEILKASIFQVAIGADCGGKPMREQLEFEETPEQFVKRHPQADYFSINEIFEGKVLIDGNSLGPNSSRVINVTSEPLPITGMCYVDGEVMEAEGCYEARKQLELDSEKVKDVKVVKTRTGHYFIYNNGDRIIDTQVEKRELMKKFRDFAGRRREFVRQDLDCCFKETESGSPVIDKWLSGLEELRKGFDSSWLKKILDRGYSLEKGLSGNVESELYRGDHRPSEEELTKELADLLEKGRAIDTKADNRFLKKFLPGVASRFIKGDLLGILAARTIINERTNTDYYFNQEAHDRLPEMQQAVTDGNIEVLYLVINEFLEMAKDEGDRAIWTEMRNHPLADLYQGWSIEELEKVARRFEQWEHRPDRPLESLISAKRRLERAQNDKALYKRLMDIFKTRGLVREDVVKANYNDKNWMISWNKILKATKDAPKLPA